MCRRLRAAAVVLGLVAAVVRAADTVPAKVSETTSVRGHVPVELAGRWLVVHDARLPNKQVRVFARLWEVRRGLEHLEMGLRQVELPDALKQQLAQATKDGKSWRPTAEDLTLLDQRWDDLPAIPESGLERVETDLVGADAFDDDLKRDAESKGSDFAIVTKEFFSGPQPVKSTIAVYGVREMAPTALAGTFVSTSIAVALFPVPITLRGSFGAYRLGDAPAPSFLTRVLDLFRGCGRR